MASVRRFAVATSITTALLIAGGTTASASQPEIVRIEDIHIVQTDSTSCSFPFLEEFTGTVTITTFFDEDGNPTAVRFHLPFKGTLTNETTDETVRAQQVLVDTLDLQAGTEVLAGLRFRVVFPGFGALLLDVGRVVLDETGAVAFEAGPHQVIHEDFEAFCDAFAG